MTNVALTPNESPWQVGSDRVDRQKEAVVDPSDRILDANLNRAREALRVLEDYARLGLEDAALSAAAKTLRHALADAVREAGLTGLIAARDISGDLGCAIAAKGEYERSSLASVVVASGKRLTEALRVIEEVGKTRSATFGAAVERIRYQAYDLEARLAARIGPRERFDAARLYVLITESRVAGPGEAPDPGLSRLGRPVHRQ